MRFRTTCAIVAVCISVAPSVMGQAPGVQKSANPVLLTPEQENKSQAQWKLAQSASSSLHAGNYVEAETRARLALSMGQDSGVAHEVLAAALEAQGKDREALEAYQLVVDHYDRQSRSLLPYAELLLKSGQWKQSVATYNEAITHLPDNDPHPEAPAIHDGDIIRANSQFSLSSPQPVALMVAIHIARGLVNTSGTSWAGERLRAEGIVEYRKALQLNPDSGLANYYYGNALQKLTPTERAKFGGIPEAKASLQKAVNSSKGVLKVAAKKALQVVMRA